MQARATTTARYFKPDQMGTFVQALAKMGIKPDTGLEDAKSGRGGRVGPQENDWSTAEIMRCTDARGLLELVQQHGQSFKSIHVSAAWGQLSTMQSAGGGGDEGVVLQQLQVLTRAKMLEMGARGVANVVHSMARLHGSGRLSVDDDLVGELQARAKARAGDFKPQDVSGLMLALAKMGVKPDAGLVEAMQARATERAGGNTVTQLTPGGAPTFPWDPR